MEKNYKITRCIRNCPFYTTGMDGMECSHPYFNDKEVYANMIITHSDIIPKKCPLKREPLTVTYTI